MSDLPPEEQHILSTYGDLGLEQRRLCQTSILELGMLLGHNYENPARFHSEAASAIENKEKFLLLAPRGHGKTVLCNEVGAIFEILRDPDIRILLCHGTLDRAKLILKGATDHFRTNQRLRQLFPEHCPTKPSEDPTLTRFTTLARRKPTKEPTIMAAAPGSTVTALHFDLIQFTDLVNEQNVPPPIGMGTVESSQKIVEFIKNFSPLLDITNPEARAQGNMTRWYLQDASSYIIDNWDHFRIIQQGIDIGPDGECVPIWDLVTAQQLEEKRTEAGSWLWAANYQQSPLALDEALFLPHYFREYQVLPDDVSLALCIDLAYSEKKTADETAMCVAGTRPNGDVYVAHTSKGRWSAADFIDRLFTLVMQFKLRYVGIESIDYDKFVKYTLLRAMRERGVYFQLKKLIPDASKTRRAFAMASHAEQRGIYVRTPDHDELVKQCCEFGATRYDDLFDAFNYHGYDLFLPSAVLNVKPAPRRLVLTAKDFEVSGADLLRRRHGPKLKGTHDYLTA